MWELDYKESWAEKNWCFWSVVLEKTLSLSPLVIRRSNQSILKEISPEYSLEGLRLKLKLQYFSHLMWRTDSLEKTLMLGKTEGRRGDDRGWNGWMAYRLDGHEFEQAPGAGDGQGNLVCCGPWCRKKSHTTELLNWTELIVSRDFSGYTWLRSRLYIIQESQ